MEITAKAIMERLNHIEDIIETDANRENQERLLRESEIRQEMRIEHAKRLLAFGIDSETIEKVTDLRVEFTKKLQEELER